VPTHGFDLILFLKDYYEIFKDFNKKFKEFSSTKSIFSIFKKFSRTTLKFKEFSRHVRTMSLDPRINGLRKRKFKMYDLHRSISAVTRSHGDWSHTGKEV
jgi:hypothetical protein